MAMLAGQSLAELGWLAQVPMLVDMWVLRAPLLLQPRPGATSCFYSPACTNGGLGSFYSSCLDHFSIQFTFEFLTSPQACSAFPPLSSWPSPISVFSLG